MVGEEGGDEQKDFFKALKEQKLPTAQSLLHARAVIMLPVKQVTYIGIFLSKIPVTFMKGSYILREILLVPFTSDKNWELENIKRLPRIKQYIQVVYGKDGSRTRTSWVVKWLLEESDTSVVQLLESIQFTV